MLKKTSSSSANKAIITFLQVLKLYQHIICTILLISNVSMYILANNMKMLGKFLSIICGLAKYDVEFMNIFTECLGFVATCWGTESSTNPTQLLLLLTSQSECATSCDILYYYSETVKRTNDFRTNVIFQGFLVCDKGYIK